MKLAQGGVSWVAAGCIVVVLFCSITYFSNNFFRGVFGFFSILFVLITILLIVFFRDPERTVGSDVVSPADGFIREITKEKDKDVGNCVKISIFMNIHNVHVNRMPIDGVIQKITYFNGGHIPAFKKESERNERVVTLINTSIGRVKLVQIAGTVARRIVPYVHKGDTVNKGERVGLIRLGSRVDVYLPEDGINNVKVTFKDKVKAGESSIAEIND